MCKALAPILSNLSALRIATRPPQCSTDFCLVQTSTKLVAGLPTIMMLFRENIKQQNSFEGVCWCKLPSSWPQARVEGRFRGTAASPVSPGKPEMPEMLQEGTDDCKNTMHRAIFPGKWTPYIHGNPEKYFWTRKNDFWTRKCFLDHFFLFGLEKRIFGPEKNQGLFPWYI